MRDEFDHQSEFARKIGRSISHLNRMRKRFMTENLRGYELSGSLYMFLITLERTPGVSQDFLADRFAMDKGNVARGIKKLLELEYIRRETDPADRRQNNLYLTEKGLELIPVIRTYLREWSMIMAGSLSDEERSVIVSLLERMMESGSAYLSDGK